MAEYCVKIRRILPKSEWLAAMLLAEPRHRIIMGSRAFHFSVPREWNRLPLSLHSTNSLPSFKKRLKTFLLGFQVIGKLIGIHLVANYPRLRFTFRCDLAYVIN